MVEFATLSAVLSLLTTSLGTLQQGVANRMVSSNTVALTQAVAQARKTGAPPAGARASYRRAPYRLPGLRYVYSLGWMSGTHHQTMCLLARLDLAGTRGDLIAALKKSPSSLHLVHELHLTVAQAGTAFNAGFASAC